MKKTYMAICFLLFLLMFLPLKAQITYDWGIISADSDSIYAYVHAINESGSATLGLTFNNWPWVKLFVNGAWDMNAPDSSGGIVEEGLTFWVDYTEYISYNPVEPIPPGDYQVDVRHFSAPYNYTPFLEVLPVHVADVFEFIDFVPQVTMANTNLIAATLTMHNAATTSCVINYPNNQWIQMYLDGVQVVPTYQNNPASMTISPNGDYSSYFLYNPVETIPYGAHTLQFAVSNYGNTPPATFTVENPSGNQDEVTVNPQLKMYPNPFTTELVIEYQGNKGQLNQVDIYNLKGQKIRSLSINANQKEGKIVWDGRDKLGRQTPVGVYLVKIKDISLSRVLRIGK